MSLFRVTSFVLLYSVLVSGGNITVSTNLGKVSGVSKVTLFQKKEYYSFLGIPYAEPPLDELRFMPPQPKKEWDDIWKAHKEPEACAQFYMPVRVRNNNFGHFGKEDCLYLSVHTPKIETNEAFPVIMLTLNDHFKTSYNGSRDYAPDFFIEDGVIIVTFSHRLGSIGFLSMEDDVLPGNNGLRDCILALKWIQDNIRFFGGDPNKVTLMGSFGGAVVADLLLNSKKAKGLFSSVILQSGTSWNSMYLGNNCSKDAINLSKEVGKKARTSTTLLKNFKKVSAQDLLENEVRLKSDNMRSMQKSVVPFGPRVEGDNDDAVINALPEERLTEIDVPIMMGFNSREGIEYSSRYLRKPTSLTYMERDLIFLFPVRKNYHFKTYNDAYFDAIHEIKEFYFKEGEVKISKPGEFITYIGDLLSIYPIDYTVRQYANASKAPVFYYTFDYSGLLNAVKIETLKDATVWDGTWGATLRDEMCYLFVCTSIKKKYLSGLKNPEDFEELKVIRKMVRLWSNFAKTGNPTPPKQDDILNGFIWTPITVEDSNILEITKDLKMKKNHLAGRMKFWDNFLQKYEEKAINGVVRTVRVREDGEEDLEEGDKEDYEESDESEETENKEPIYIQEKVRIAGHDEF